MIIKGSMFNMFNSLMDGDSLNIIKRPFLFKFEKLNATKFERFKLGLIA